MQNYFPQVSIIVPVYNVKEYLTKCLDSLMNQSFADIEVILVDDGSTDESSTICDLYAMRDNRIKVIHKENGGSASARESGIKAASGNYVMFVDGDDWIDDNTVEQCMRAVNKYPGLDCVLFSYVKEFPNHSIPMYNFEKSFYIKNRGLEYKVYRRLFGLYGKELSNPEKMETMASCCMKLYTLERAKQGAYFDTQEVGSAEDALFNMYALYGMKEAVYINRCFYHYRKREDSLTGAYRPRLKEQWKKLFSIMEGIIDEKHLDYTYKKTLSNRVALSITAIALNEISNKEHTVFEQIKVIRTYLNDTNYRESCEQVSIKNMPVVWKIYVVCAKLKLAVLIYLMSRVASYLRKR